MARMQIRREELLKKESTWLSLMPYTSNALKAAFDGRAPLVSEMVELGMEGLRARIRAGTSITSHELDMVMADVAREFAVYGFV